MIVGYARVSSDGQALGAQQAALVDAGCARVFSEKQSGAKTDRAQLAKAIAALGNSDVLIVTKLDRLARSTRDLLNTLDGSARLALRSSRWVIAGPILRPRQATENELELEE